MKANEFDKKFEDGEDVFSALDLSTARQPNQSVTKIDVDFPTWMLDVLDKEATRLSVTKQFVIQEWIGERISSPK